MYCNGYTILQRIYNIATYMISNIIRKLNCIHHWFRELKSNSNRMISNDYQKLAAKEFAKKESESPECRYWKKFKVLKSNNFSSPVNSIDFCNSVAPYDYVVTSSTRCYLYCGKNGTVKKTFSRFKNIVRDAKIRSDGKLLLASSDSSVIKLFDINTKSQLREYKSHVAPVYKVCFSRGEQDKGKYFVSTSDDRTIKYWDITNEICIHSYNNLHTDYIRSACFHPTQSHIFATGGYDHHINIIDSRNGGSNNNNQILKLKHDYPIESLLYLKQGTLLLASGGNKIKIYDMLSGGKVIHEISNHQKTITSLCVDGTGNRILSASLDNYVKIYNMNTFHVVASIKYHSPILNLGINKGNSRIVSGMSTGELAIRSKSSFNSASGTSYSSSNLLLQQKQQAAPARGGTHRYFVRGKNTLPSNDDYKIASRRKTRLKPYDIYIKKFQYKDALDAVLNTRQPALVVSMLEELILNSSLENALSNRTDERLEPLLSFLIKFVTNPKYSTILINVCTIVLNLYTYAIGHSTLVDELFLKLQKHLKTEVNIQKDLFHLLGKIDLMLNTAKN